MISEKDIYTNKYDYDDIKIAVCITDFLNQRNLESYYDDIASLVIEIKDHWDLDKENGYLSQTEFAYIQEYAYKYLQEKFR